MTNGATRPNGFGQKCHTPWDQSPGKILLVLPAYNEEENLGELLRQVDQTMCDEQSEYEVIVVDDGSADRTGEIAREFAMFIPLFYHRHVVNQGLGTTIRDGLEIAARRAGERDVVVAMDADNSHNPAAIHNMVRLVREGNDVVICSRYRTGSCIRGVPFHRQLLSIGARLLFQTAFPVAGVRDYTCGYRAYRASLLLEAHQRFGSEFVSVTGFQCMVDILLKLRAMGAIFCEVPMVLRYDLKGGVSKMRVARTVLATLKLLIERRFTTGWTRPVVSVIDQDEPPIAKAA